MHPTLLRENMRYWQMKPDPRLRPWVLCYYLARPALAASPGAVFPSDGALCADGVLCAGTGPAPACCDEELLIPDGHSEIVFTIDGAYERWAVGCAERRRAMSESYVIGGRSCSVITRDLAPVTVAGIKLDPRALRWLIATPLVEFRDSTLALRALGHPALLDLEGAVADLVLTDSRSAEQLAALFDVFLLDALRDMPAAARPVDELVAQIRASRGSISIMGWTERHGLEARQMERHFAATIGMTPKRYARVIRFKHSYHQLIAGASHPRGVHLDGFYDQSHFNKEFRAFIGSTPTARLAAALRQGTSISDHLLAGELSTP